MRRLDRILARRELGMPLGEIAKQLDRNGGEAAAKGRLTTTAPDYLKRAFAVGYG